MASSPEVSVVIPAWNEADWLPATLAAARAALDALDCPGELIVVDNASTDATADVAHAAGATVVTERVNQIARARNTGARAASGRYLVFVDADTRVPAELLRQAHALLAAGRACGGGARVALDGDPGPFPRAAVRLWNRLSMRLRRAAGCFLFCRRDAFEAVGGFDEKLYASEELRASRNLERWGRRRGLPFVIIAAPPAVTSDRKAHWYSTGQQLALLALLLIFPCAVRSRRLARFWYRRPRQE